MQSDAQASGANQGPTRLPKKQLEINSRISHDFGLSSQYGMETTIHKCGTARLVPVKCKIATIMGVGSIMLTKRKDH